MSRKSLVAAGAAILALVLVACAPTFPEGSSVTTSRLGSKQRIVWPEAAASDPVNDVVVEYVIYVDQSEVARVSAGADRCTLGGISPGTSYEVEVAALDQQGHLSAKLLASFTTALDQDDSANPLDCVVVGS